MKKLFIFAFLYSLSIAVCAQIDERRKAFEEFKRQIRQEYNDFRNKANAEYADFVREAWKQYKQLPAIPQPKEDKPVPPLVYPEEDKQEQKESVPLPVVDVVPIPLPVPQPKPIEPIKEEIQPIDTYFSFKFFGTVGKVRLNEKMRFRLPTCRGEHIAQAWEFCSCKEYNNVIRDCLELRIRYNLCDWAYLLMLKEMANSFLEKGSNEATLLMAYLYCQSGYKMRLAQSGDRLVLLYSSHHTIYDQPYYEIGGEYYYPMDYSGEELFICEVAFPNEQPLSLLIDKEQQLNAELSVERLLQSKSYFEMKAQVVVNKNLIDFYNTYPVSEVGNNFMSRWAMYANTPLNAVTKDKLYPMLQSVIKGLSQKEAVERLLNFVQTAFVYEYDSKVWGRDRAFFAEETLYYPYADCEDRSILFTRLVRDLLGLKCVLVYYPGHLATAVCFTEPVNGDYILVENNRYIVCDPTYIGAPVGATMPAMNNQAAKVALLE